MSNLWKLIVVALGAVLVACQWSPPRSTALEEARRAFKLTREDPLVARAAASELQQAQLVLHQAERVWLETRDEAATSHLAYLAYQRVVLARNLGLQREVEDRMQRAALESGARTTALAEQVVAKPPVQVTPFAKPVLPASADVSPSPVVAREHDERNAGDAQRAAPDAAATTREEAASTSSPDVAAPAAVLPAAAVPAAATPAALRPDESPAPVAPKPALPARLQVRAPARDWVQARSSAAPTTAAAPVRCVVRRPAALVPSPRLFASTPAPATGHANVSHASASASHRGKDAPRKPTLVAIGSPSHLAEQRLRVLYLAGYGRTLPN